MQIDKKIIKALGSETRIKILKALLERRKMPSELSNELSLAGSTVVEHLKILEEAGLVSKKETGRKWIYYELTNIGEGLIKPKYPTQFVVVLSLGLLFVFLGFTRYFSPPLQAATPLLEAGKTIVEAQPTDYLTIALFVVGLVLIVFGLIRLRR